MRLAFLCNLCFLIACTSPQDRLQQIESGMLELLGPAADLKVPVQDGSLPLPLPPPLEVQTAQKIQASRLLAEAEKIDSSKLEPIQRQQLQQYRQVLTDLSGSTAGWPVDPLMYTLYEPFQRCLSEPDGESLATLLEKTPDYYTEVEQRWGPTNPRSLHPTETQCLSVLDQLDRLENDLIKYPLPVRTRLQAALPAAKAAWKNYLGLCRSSVLE